MIEMWRNVDWISTGGVRVTGEELVWEGIGEGENEVVSLRFYSGLNGKASEAK